MDEVSSMQLMGGEDYSVTVETTSIYINWQNKVTVSLSSYSQFFLKGQFLVTPLAVVKCLPVQHKKYYRVIIPLMCPNFRLL